ncbi:non-ribosomal peptide synthetase [Segniliparus rugosus]|uniref:Amino acid adenylation domain-containing protein n=1 Tax=Segniliparus rugosus (strain ATCC BAA-974 / DSM 45345 / CCUG 50838 / CIP 108380 / JCM 13579 / CDC 945) TaxID=679197 RepID=E5XLS9_SEGRC|nr:non-ribosomal peptide synthetase [Segniliparus rugosus]EFV14691.1 amino acid adenylation domain-containing protein [Segniliparus rugosus ATCC BAA-974]
MTTAAEGAKQQQKARIEDVLALSPLQGGLFSLAKLAGDEADMYTVQLVVDIEGPLDAGLLRRSAQAVLDRHPNLRASFWDRDLPKPVQIIPSFAELPWQELDIAAEDLDAAVAEDRVRRFDLERGPALRFLLFTLPDGTRRMVFTVHHILMDGWAMAIFYRELLAVYAAGGDTGGLPPARPYRDYIGWLEARDHAEALAVWREHLAGASPLLLCEPAEASSEALAPQKHTAALDEDETARLVEWARAQGMTLSTITQYAWAVLLSRLSDRSDVVFGVVVAGRPASLSGVESMVGLFINTTPSRVRIDPSASVREQCAQLQRDASRLRDVDYLSLSETQRASGHGTLFDTLFVYENAPIGDATQAALLPGGVRLRPLGLETLTHYPLTVVPLLFQNRLEVTIEALPGVLPAPASLLGERLLSIVRQMPACFDGSPDDLDALLPGECEQILAASVAPGLPARSAPDQEQASVAEMLWAHAAQTPDAVALSWSGGSLTYRELTDRAALLAARLAERGVGPETVVALSLRRSPEFVVALFGVLAAGAAYVPLDPALPEARRESILRQAAPALVLAEGDPVFEAVGAPLAAPVRVHPDQAAYVIFTSGSTGEPKGVVGTHRALASYVRDHWERMLRPAQERLGRPLKIAHAWSFSFDASWQPLAGLVGGHANHLFDEEEMRDAQRLADGIARHGLDMIDTSPSMLAQLDLPQLSVLALGGEALSPAQWARLSALPTTEAHNCYGPTETTVETLVAAVAEHAVPAIGHPTAGMAAYVLDSGLRLVPDGVVGELYVSGAQLTRGYAANPARTAERYVADPFVHGRRMYRTGDLARRLPSGAVQCLGRADEQVKIRGHRIELGEVEAALLALPQVRAAAVAAVARPNGDGVGSSSGGGLVLAACVVPKEGAFEDLPASQGQTSMTPAAARLRAALAERLPGYMIPARLVVRDQLPLTANGKLDASVFADMAEAEGEEPSTPTECLIAGLLAEQLGVRSVAVDQDFFDLGVDSITAIALVGKARRGGVRITPRMIMRAGTVRALAAEAESAVAAAASADPLEPAPLLPVGRWLVELGGFRRFGQWHTIRLPEQIGVEQLRTLLQLLVDSHPMLRSRLDGELLSPAPVGSVRAEDFLHVGHDPTREARAALERLDPESGRMVQAVWLPDDGRLILVVHSLVVDPVSWQIILGELAQWWTELERGESPGPVAEVTSYAQWSQEVAKSRADHKQTEGLQRYEAPLGNRRLRQGQDTMAGVRFTVQRPETMVSNEQLLEALHRTLAKWRGPVAVAVESHGRPDEPWDTSSTVGLFASISPLEPATQVLFNYLGRIVVAGAQERPWQVVVNWDIADDLNTPEPDLPIRHELALLAATVEDGDGPRLVCTWRWHKDIFTEEQIAELQEIWDESLRSQA